MKAYWNNLLKRLLLPHPHLLQSPSVQIGYRFNRSVQLGIKSRIFQREMQYNIIRPPLWVSKTITCASFAISCIVALPVTLGRLCSELQGTKIPEYCLILVFLVLQTFCLRIMLHFKILHNSLILCQSQARLTSCIPGRLCHCLETGFKPL